MTRPLDVARWPRWRRDLTTSVSPADSPLTVTFPTTPLVSRVQIALGADLSADPSTWAWLDITPYVRWDLGVSLRTGRRDEASTVSTGSATLKLDNRDGRFTRRNPSSPYYGLLSKNTPIWATVDAGSGEKTRLEMFVNEWPKTWADKSATDSTVTIRCAGIWRRLAQGEVLKGPLLRALTAARPYALWALEDASGSSSGASGLPNGSPLSVSSGTVDWAASEPPAGAAAAPVLTSSGRLQANLATSSTTTYTVEFAAKCALAPDGIPLAVAMSGSTYMDFRVFTQITGGFPAQLVAYTTPSSSTTFGDFPVLADAAYDGKWHHYRFTLKQSGSNVVARVWLDGVSGGGNTWTATMGQFTSVTINSGLLNSTITGSVSGVAIYNYEMLDDHTDAMLLGWVGEQAHERIERLCDEEGVLFQTLAATSAAMGVQGTNTLLTLLRECEAADGGVLYEKRWGLAYQSLAERYNAPVGLALDIAQGHLAEIPEPADDDQRTRNRWTVRRTNGSEYTAEQTTGPMGAGIEGPGLYDDAVTLNIEDDSQLSDQAYWRVHLGIVDEDRWPDVGLNFARQPGLIDTWSALGYGARTTLANPLPQMPPDPPDLIIEGHSERWNSKQWSASLNCSPASPYRIATVEDPSELVDTPRVGSGTAVLETGIDDDDTSLSVTTGTGGLWTTSGADFPLDINIGGERIRLSAISGASSPQTFTVSARSQNGIVKSHLAGAAVEVWQIATVGL